MSAARSKTKEFSGTSASGPAKDVLDAAANSGDLKELEDNFDIGPEEEVRKNLEQTSLNPQDERRGVDSNGVDLHSTEVSSVQDGCVRPKQLPFRPKPASKSQEADETTDHQLTPSSDDQEIAVPNISRDLVQRNLLQGGNVTFKGTSTKISQTNPGVEIHHASQEVTHSQPAPVFNFRNIDVKDGGRFEVVYGPHVEYHGDRARPLDTAEVVSDSVPDLKETYRPHLESQRKITADDMEDVCGKIGLVWKELARKLGFEKGDIDSFEYDNRSEGLKQICYEMLYEWLERKSDEATISELTTAILDLATDSSHKCEILDSFDP